MYNISFQKLDSGVTILWFWGDFSLTYQKSLKLRNLMHLKVVRLSVRMLVRMVVRMMVRMVVKMLKGWWLGMALGMALG